MGIKKTIKNAAKKTGKALKKAGNEVLEKTATAGCLVLDAAGSVMNEIDKGSEKLGNTVKDAWKKAEEKTKGSTKK